MKKETLIKAERIRKEKHRHLIVLGVCLLCLSAGLSAYEIVGVTGLTILGTIVIGLADL